MKERDTLAIQCLQAAAIMLGPLAAATDVVEEAYRLADALLAKRTPLYAVQRTYNGRTQYLTIPGSDGRTWSERTTYRATWTDLPECQHAAAKYRSVDGARIVNVHTDEVC